ncbi:MAG TPA: alpha-glucan family phosphorylase, partial [Gammaproteobacteria bacterium]
LNEDYWEKVDDIPDHSFWSTRQSLKTKLFDEVYQRVAHQYRRNGYSPTQIERLTQHIASQDPDILTIGFARRFATYKRALLLFSNPERLARLVNDSNRPVLFIFAGKAHPHDIPGQQLLKAVHDFSRRPEFEGKIILVEGYDLALARKLVTGVDVWLNTPQYPLEASGTSGEKAGINGVINLSVLDGWWGEGFNGENGWAISPHGPHFDERFRNHEEANELMDLLESQIIPMYYHRNGHGYSAEWVKKSKNSLKSLMPRFNAQRMVMGYVRQYYSNAKEHFRILSQDNYKSAKELSQWKKNIAKSWPKVTIRRLSTAPTAIRSGDTLPIEIAVNLHGLHAEDIYAECLVGVESDTSELLIDNIYKMEASGENSSGETHFRLDLRSQLPGLQQYKIRIYPYHSLLSRRFETGYMLWL